MQNAHSPAYQDAIFIRLFRKWSIAREMGEPAMPAMHQEAQTHGFDDPTAVIASSLFQLVEGTIGRPLSRECSCLQNYSCDERALIGILRQAPVLRPGCGSRAIPHGLPGAICWAAQCLCDAMHINLDKGLAALPSSAVNSQGCPFAIAQAA